MKWMPDHVGGISRGGTKKANTLKFRLNVSNWSNVDLEILNERKIQNDAFPLAIVASLQILTAKRLDTL